MDTLLHVWYMTMRTADTLEESSSLVYGGKRTQQIARALAHVFVACACTPFNSIFGRAYDEVYLHWSHGHMTTQGMACIAVQGPRWWPAHWLVPCF